MMRLRKEKMHHKNLALSASASKPLFFVTGVMRSGTTLLQRILAHSCESEFVKEVVSIHVMVESLEILDRSESFVPLGRDGYVELYRQLLTSTLDACADKMFGDVLILKDPMALRTLKLLQELAPQLKFLLLVRNPLDTTTSILRVRNRQRRKGQDTFIARMDFGDIVNYVSALNNIIIDVRDSRNICLIQFEELVRKNARSAARLQDFVGVAIDLKVADTSSDYDPEHAFWTPESGRPIQATSLGKYREELSTEQIELVKNAMVRFNTCFGYTRDFEE